MSKYIGVDFDGTIVKHDYPRIGEPIPGAIETLHDLVDAGHKIILYTMRSGEPLVEAIEYLERHAVKLYGANENPSQKHWTKSPKVYCHLYIDDAALGCPLAKDQSDSRPYVHWERVRFHLRQQGYLPQ